MNRCHKPRPRGLASSGRTHRSRRSSSPPPCSTGQANPCSDRGSVPGLVS
jgi:hypothetical protein